MPLDWREVVYCKRNLCAAKPIRVGQRVRKMGTGLCLHEPVRSEQKASAQPPFFVQVRRKRCMFGAKRAGLMLDGQRGENRGSGRAPLSRRSNTQITKSFILRVAAYGSNKGVSGLHVPFHHAAVKKYFPREIRIIRTRYVGSRRPVVGVLEIRESTVV
jgi:hypothetical protein